ncbi:MAG: hypothetical protein EA381_13110 [Planctomycetaceae bacterium]|nr:MAG: hypothetical protein EA381_13110 [Planctomycetaceae bacterium]
MITAEQVPPIGHSTASNVSPGSVDDAYQLARLYDSLGFSMIPIRPGTKVAASGWKRNQTERASIDEVLPWIAAGNGLGVVLGQVSNGWVCRDFDDESAFERWAEAYPQLADSLPRSRTGRGFHVYVRVAEKAKTKAWRDGELRGDAAYVVIPPSEHPTAAGAYQWIIHPHQGEPARVLAATGLNRSWLVTEKIEKQSTQNGFSADSVVSVSLSKTVGAVSVGQWEAIQDAIELTVPPAIGNRSGGKFNGLFRLARKVIAILGGRPGPDLTEQIGMAWFEAAQHVIGTGDPGVTCADFAHAIESVRAPDSGDPIAMAFEASKALPIPPFVQRFAAFNESAPTIQLAKLVVSLDQRFSGGVWYLSCHVAGRLVGMKHSHAHSVLKKWVKDGILKIVEPGKPGKPGNKATRYQFVGGRVENSAEA